MSAAATRRQIIGTGGALLLIVAEAGAAKAAQLECELLDGTATDLSPDSCLIELERQLQAQSAAADATITDEALSEELAAYWNIADQIADMPAHTAAGIQAKARAFRSVWHMLKAEDEDEGHIARHAFGIVMDVLGEDNPG